ncbi:unnamed protein product, partial [Choristocarpus tenellus]
MRPLGALLFPIKNKVLYRRSRHREVGHSVAVGTVPCPIYQSKMVRLACFPYLVITTVVMAAYSMFLLHLANVFHFSPSTSQRFVPPERSSGAGTLVPCPCTVESLEAMDSGTEVAMSLSFPYRYFDSNHWFHISEYYV